MKPKVLILVDRPHWAYHNIAKELVKHLGEDYAFDLRFNHEIDYVNKNHAKWDLIFSMGWKWIKKEIKTPQGKTISVVHSYRTLDGESPDYWADYLNQRYCAVGVVNRDLLEMFDGSIDNLFLTANGVDGKRFCPVYNVPEGKLTIGWAGCGSKKFRGLDLIEEAAARTKCRIQVQNADEKKIPHGDMPSFYHGIDCYVNASESEGCSLTILEACSSGRPLLATRTGVAKELIEEGKTGYFIERNVDSIIEAITKATKLSCRWMGNSMRVKILDNWLWRKQVKGYKALIDCGLNHE